MSTGNMSRIIVKHCNEYVQAYWKLDRLMIATQHFSWLTDLILRATSTTAETTPTPEVIVEF